MTRLARRAVVPTCLVQALWGGVLLLRPRTALRLLGQPPSEAAVLVVRVLGARQVVQAGGTLAVPARGVVTGGALVDLAHASTAVAYAASDPRRRRPGATSAALAALTALGGAAALRRHPPSSGPRP